jgi:ParD-like antitoxin of type II ParDE toxin-antitoxin system
MAVPVKVSDRLLTLAREEARTTHRSATAQIEHWATLGRAVETLVTYRDALALKRAGQTLPLPAFVRPDEVDALLADLAGDPDRDGVKARIRGEGGPVYVADPGRPGAVVRIEPDGTRTTGRLQHREFVVERRAPRLAARMVKRKPARRK